MIPINDQVIIEELKEDTKKVGMIEIPPSVNPHEKLAKGVVKFVCEDYITSSGVSVPMSVKVGDIVLFSTRTQRLKYEDKNYFIAKENQLLAILGD
mgnify:CR=1 FL=1